MTSYDLPLSELLNAVEHLDRRSLQLFIDEHHDENIFVSYRDGITTSFRIIDIERTILGQCDYLKSRMNEHERCIFLGMHQIASDDFGYVIRRGLLVDGAGTVLQYDNPGPLEVVADQLASFLV